MEPYVFFAVLAAAFCHASWNAGLKLKLEPAVAITLTAVGAGVVALPLAPFAGMPDAASWPYLAASLGLHYVYWRVLGEAYSTGDLGQVYPIARGTAPLLTTIGGVLVWGEFLSPGGFAGVAMLGCGVLLLSLKGGRSLAEVDKRAVGFAFATAAVISLYTLVDGRGSRLSGNPHAYSILLFVLDGVMMAAYGAIWQRASIASVPRRLIPAILGGGGLSLAAYWIALWAMTKAPIALVAAVRETSVLFAAAIGVFILKEPVIGARVAAAVLVVAGLVLIRLS